MQLTIRGLLSNQASLRGLLTILEWKNSGVDIILLCETFLTIHMEKLVHIQRHTLIINNRSAYKGRGTAILIPEISHSKVDQN